eukprot:TRINITY_DN6544_c0_g1_i3.p1 TRINITY_DN6544_c0_g1~~TRINITY_DN6544_c0_g1_i3.p1  ORF type:complete len:111 (-),score=10.24 TRINITY_DN6544_c0_g1_i3:139-471(-)
MQKSAIIKSIEDKNQSNSRREIQLTAIQCAYKVGWLTETAFPTERVRCRPRSSRIELLTGRGTPMAWMAVLGTAPFGDDSGDGCVYGTSDTGLSFVLCRLRYDALALMAF